MGIRYYIYIDGLLGLKTDINNFSWTYGTVMPPPAEESDYDKCLIKADFCLKKDADIKPECDICDCFQCFSHTAEGIYYSRKLFGLSLAYNIKSEGNSVSACFGKNYFKLVKGRMMNMHSYSYILSDLVNTLLLKNGFLSLYCSAAYDVKKEKTLLMFSPPNTGKTLTENRLCKEFGYIPVTEDVAVTDGKRVWSCPMTCSARKTYKKNKDSAGSFGRVKTDIDIDGFKTVSEIGSVFVLSKKPKNAVTHDLSFTAALNKIKILNGYLFNYSGSPIVKITSYFNREYALDYNGIAARIAESFATEDNTREIVADNSFEFADIIVKMRD